MYLICYLGMGNTICVKAKCETVEAVRAIVNDVRDNEDRSGLKAEELFVLTSAIGLW